MFWKIEEKVDGGYYITLDGNYNTKQEAEEKIIQIGLNTENMRAVQYRRGNDSKGPVRVED